MCLSLSRFGGMRGAATTVKVNLSESRAKKTLLSCLWVTVPETDTGRLPVNGKALGRYLVKELGNLAPYVCKKGCHWYASISGRREVASGTV